MQNKRQLGQYYTVNNPFTHPLFRQWMDLVDKKQFFLEPFAGANNILRLMAESGYEVSWQCYDIEPSLDNSYPQFKVEYRDTIADFPKGYDVCVTNCPYLGKSSARRRKIDYPWEEDDLYKVCLNIMLNNCKYIAAIIPESYITANFRTERLWGVISLTCKMFSDTDCPVCLAMFVPQCNNNPKIYSNETYLGFLKDLQKIDLTGDTSYHTWVFNDKDGNIGVKTIDSQSMGDCKFFEGELINPNDIKVSSRSFTRISGLPNDIDRGEFFNRCNIVLEDYRKKTKDVLMTSFKGLRKDGQYRRRLDFRTVRCILNTVLREMQNNSDNTLF